MSQPPKWTLHRTSLAPVVDSMMLQTLSSTWRQQYSLQVLKALKLTSPQTFLVRVGHSLPAQVAGWKLGLGVSQRVLVRGLMTRGALKHFLCGTLPVLIVDLIQQVLGLGSPVHHLVQVRSMVMLQVQERALSQMLSIRTLYSNLYLYADSSGDQLRPFLVVSLEIFRSRIFPVQVQGLEIFLYLNSAAF